MSQVGDKPTAVKAMTTELWTHVFSYCREPLHSTGGYQSQSTLAALMRVSSVFNCTAGPILYSHVAVRNFNSFFLGTIPPSRIPSPSTVLPFGRITKNDLLAYVRTMHLIAAKSSSMPETQRAADETDLWTIEETNHLRLDSLCRYLDNLIEPEPQLLTPLGAGPSSHVPTDHIGLLPRLRHIKVEEKDPGTTSFMNSRQPQFAPYLMRLGSPEYWCSRSPESTADYILQPLFKDIVNRRLPKKYISHVLPEESLMIMAGTHNIVYMPSKIVTGLSALDEFVHDESIEHNIRVISGEVEDVLSDATLDVDGEARTRPSLCDVMTSLMVYIPVISLSRRQWHAAKEMQQLPGRHELLTSYDDDPVVAGREVTQIVFDRIKQTVLERTADRGHGLVLAEDKLSIKGEWEAEPCPCCGRMCLGGDNDGDGQ